MAGRRITIRSGPRSGESYAVEGKEPTAPGGTNTETGEVESADQAVDRMAGTPSNAGRSAQSTDAMNRYQ